MSKEINVYEEWMDSANAEIPIGKIFLTSHKKPAKNLKQIQKEGLKEKRFKPKEIKEYPLNPKCEGCKYLEGDKNNPKGLCKIRIIQKQLIRLDGKWIEVNKEYSQEEYMRIWDSNPIIVQCVIRDCVKYPGKTITSYINFPILKRESKKALIALKEKPLSSFDTQKRGYKFEIQKEWERKSNELLNNQNKKNQALPTIVRIHNAYQSMSNEFKRNTTWATFRECSQ